MSTHMAVASRAIRWPKAFDARKVCQIEFLYIAIGCFRRLLGSIFRASRVFGLVRGSGTPCTTICALGCQRLQAMWYPMPVLAPVTMAQSFPSWLGHLFCFPFDSNFFHNPTCHRPRSTGPMFVFKPIMHPPVGGCEGSFKLRYPVEG